MTDPVARSIIEMTGRGLRGESFGDVARRTGAYGVEPTDTDVVAMNKLAAAAASATPGPPGADLSQIGTLIQAKGTDILAAQPAATLVTLTDRPGPWRLWEAGMDALDPSFEDVTWFKDAGGEQWFYSPYQGAVITALGVDPEGVIDGTGLLTAARGRSIQGAGGTYKAGPINVRTQEQWEGSNSKISVPADATAFLVADAVHDWRISGWQLEGSLVTAPADPDAESEVGIQVRDATRGIISNMSFRNFKNAGILRNAVSFTDDGGLGRGARTIGSNLAFYACARGLVTKPNGGNEYDIYSNIHAGGCLVGVDLNAGNTILTNFHLVDNKQNMRLRGGNNNHLHNIIGDGTINHLSAGGDYLMYATDIWNGVSISNVAAYANAAGGNGAIFWERTGGINWFNGILDAWTYHRSIDFNVAGLYPYNRQENLFMPGGYGPARIFGDDGGGLVDYSQYVIRKNCFGPGVIDQLGVTTNDPADVFVLAEQNGAGIAFTSGTFLKFPQVNRIGDRRQCYDAGTGLVTIPKWMTGLYEYEANFCLSGTLATPENSYFELVLNPGTVDELVISTPILPKPFGNGLTLWTINTGRIVWHLTEGDVIGLRATTVTGAAPALGNTNWRSQFTLRKIA